MLNKITRLIGRPTTVSKNKISINLDLVFSDLINSLRRGGPRLVADLGDGVEHAPVVVMVVMEVAVVVSEACI